MKNTLKTLKSIKKDLDNLNTKVGSLIYELELPLILKRINEYKKSSKGKKITTAWLQREFQIGYAHAAVLLDTINSPK